METRILYEPRKFNFLSESEPDILTVHLIIYMNFETEEDVCSETYLIKKNGDIYRDRYKKLGERWYRVLNGVESEFPLMLMGKAKEEKLVAEELEACFIDWI